MAKSITGQDMSGWLWQPSDSNTRFNSYDPKTGQWSAGSLAGWTRDNRGDNPFVGMTDEVANYLRAMGFTGDLRQAATDSLMAKFGGGRSGLEAQNDYMASNPNWEDEIKIGRNAALDQWLQANGLTLQQGIQQTPGASQQTMIQRLVDAQGNPVAVDAFNNRYSAGDRFTNAVQLGLAAAGVAGAGNAAGLWDLSAAGAGGSGGLSAVGGGGSIAGGGGMVPAELMGTTALDAATPYIAQAMGGGLGEIGTAVVTSAGSGLGGTAGGLSAGQVAGALGGAGSLGSAASSGSASNPGGDPYDNKFYRPDGPATPGNMGGGPTVPTEYINQAPPSWIDTLKDYGSTVSDLVGGGKNLAGLVGGIAGAASGGGTNTATTQSQIDHRMAQYLYGTGYGDKNSLLGAAQDWFNTNKSGMNATMQQGLDQLKNLYSSPAYTQGYDQMRSMGQGLLSAPIAGNPYTQGLLAPPGGGAPPQANAQGLLGPNVQVPKIPAGWSI